MKIKYLYLDDENSNQTNSFAEILERSREDLEIKMRPPLPFSEEMAKLKADINDVNGLLLDLRLDMVTNDQKKAEYRALTLAQEIRTRVTEGSLKAVPIVLCSTDDRLNKSYKKDETGHDLFDKRYLKGEFIDNRKTISDQLVSLAKGYEMIRVIKSSIRNRKNELHQFFDLPKEKLMSLDVRLLNYFGSTDGKMPEHEYARLILKEMIEVPGVLIDEYFLAARLGVDQSSEDWPSLRDKFLKNCKYTGPFNEAWPRWWMHLVSEWWFSLKNCPANLSYLNASEKVDFLKSATNLKGLITQTGYKDNYSSRFWTICKALNVPIDPVDGLMVDGRSPQPWQEKEYISIDAAVKRIKFREGVRVHPFEEERLKDIKRTISQSRSGKNSTI
ncbi:hypothetical protein ACSX1A_11015 [Pontibacter sp. MBLB2868]|uniref:hypothetical protein n=1 Tax=Pontibacter sp. MBLB2868 TaxID=3451555 RepID=UPI003F750C06